MNTPYSQPDPSDHPKKTSDYRTHQLQDAAARTVRVERARLERLWNQHLDGELSADSKVEFETLCKRYPDLSRELRSTSMLLSGMNLLTADVPASPVADRDRNAAILAAVQSERPFISSAEARAIRRQRWILVGSAAALLISVVAAERFFPGWTDPAGMVVAHSTPRHAAKSGDAAVSPSAPSATPALTATEKPDARVATSASTSATASAATSAAVTPRRDALNAKAKLALGAANATDLKLSTDLTPPMASQSAIAMHSSSAFGLQIKEASLLQAIARGNEPIGPFVASARLRFTEPPIMATADLRPRFSDNPYFDGQWKGLLTDPWDSTFYIPPTGRPNSSSNVR
jgi:hypothetical protein